MIDGRPNFKGHLHYALENPCLAKIISGIKQLKSTRAIHQHTLQVQFLYREGALDLGEEEKERTNSGF